MKVLVIGGGASGMAAALTAAQVPGAQVTLLERQARVGRKLLATGNGRCNLTNRHIAFSHYHGAPPAFVRPALERFPMEETLQYFEALGLLTAEEPSGRVYPFSDQANSVVDVLRLALEAAGIEVVLGAEVLSLGKKARGYSAKTREKSYYGDKVILACGGVAGGKLGGTDLGYRLLEALGHRITPLKPALVQLRTETGPIRGLKGVRADAGIVLKRQGQTVAEGGGEVQFTDFGVSGPAILNSPGRSPARERPCSWTSFAPGTRTRCAGTCSAAGTLARRCRWRTFSPARSTTAWDAWSSNRPGSPWARPAAVWMKRRFARYCGL